MIRQQTREHKRMKELVRRINEAVNQLAYCGSLVQTKPVLKKIAAAERALSKAAVALMTLVDQRQMRHLGPRKPARKRSRSSELMAGELEHSKGER